MRLRRFDTAGGIASDQVTSGEVTAAVFESSDGTLISATAPPAPAVGGKAEAAVALVGLAFALLGAAVLLRRPDDTTARRFALFAGLAAAALGTAPAASGPHPPWALGVQFVSILAFGASLPAFAIAFAKHTRFARTLVRSFIIGAGTILGGYFLALGISPALYDIVRPAFGVYLTLSVITSLGILALRAVGNSTRPAVSEARLALVGIACGALPFIILTLVPVVAGYGDIVPWYVTASLTGFIPAAFAYAILRHQLMGIRRLVHRGMVYGMTALALLILVSLLVNWARLLSGGRASSAVTVGLVVVGALLFDVLRRGARFLVDKVIYRDEMDSQALLASMRVDLMPGHGVANVTEAIVSKLREALVLEGAALFLGTNPPASQLVASSGHCPAEYVDLIRRRQSSLPFGQHDLADVRQGSDMLLVVRLQGQCGPLGYLLLGPKEEGEVFLHEERLLVATVSPIVALALRENMLVSELREVSQRLVDAEEAERARIALDLHDGPLQKAILLHGREGDDLARDLVAEIRELCARLRPAILDDLGLVAALDWLLEQASRQHAVAPMLTLRGMNEDDRLAPETEVALFRVTQEAVTNAVRHGGARAIQVSLERSADSLELRIVDDGRGIRTGDSARRGLGIPGMRERLRQIGGGVTISSDRGRGTVVTAFIPQLRQGHAGAR